MNPSLLSLRSAPTPSRSRPRSRRSPTESWIAPRTRLAHFRRKQGVTPEARVAVCLGQSHELVVAFLGILKSRGTYLPMDPALPDKRLRFMLEDGGAVAVLTDASSTHRIPPGLSTFALEPDLKLLTGESDQTLQCEPGRDSVAYAIYTSGSTGLPKAVLMDLVREWSAEWWAAASSKPRTT